MLYYPKDGHCTEAGHALIADVVVRELDARGLFAFNGTGSPSAAR